MPAQAQANGRLGDAAHPGSYDIAIAPSAKAMTFRGSETIEVDVAVPTRTTTLDAADRAGNRASVRGIAATATATATADAATHRLTVTAPRALAAGGTASTVVEGGVGSVALPGCGTPVASVGKAATRASATMTPATRRPIALIRGSRCRTGSAC